MASEIERIVALEVGLAQVSRDITEIKESLKELLELRNKGIGAFWLASGLVGIMISGVLTTIINWLNHGHQ